MFEQDYRVQGLEYGSLDISDPRSGTIRRYSPENLVFEQGARERNVVLCGAMLGSQTGFR